MSVNDRYPIRVDDYGDGGACVDEIDVQMIAILLHLRHYRFHSETQNYKSTII